MKNFFNKLKTDRTTQIVTITGTIIVAIAIFLIVRDIVLF